MMTTEAAVNEIIKEHERAIKQRDTFVLTGVSTASHGGSHDTCFGLIVKQIQLDAYKAGLTKGAEMVRNMHHACECMNICEVETEKEILTFRDNLKELPNV